MNTLLVASLGIGTLLAIIYSGVLLVGGNKYDYMIEPLDKTEYRFSELYSFGFVFMHVTGHKFSSKDELKRRNCITILKGTKYADYYLQVEYAKRVSLVAPIVILSFIMAGIADEFLICPVMLILAFAIYLYIGQAPQKKIDARSEELLSEFPDVVSKLALLINAGMIMRNAWERVAYSEEGTIYDEMRRVVINMRDGLSENDAYYEFGNNCVIPEIKKFTSTIIQGIIKGNRELSAMLTEQSSEVWSIKMNQVKRQGDAAVTKMMVPMLIMFVGILVMILIPIFSNLGI